ncbi:MAG: prepilin-type N-terminal cleavage/methylation domain-containing protein [Burkholderiaceae bacterium]|nr:MAG: prepilin-type N-terminal cleavage/methylation domain-containing protein [Burkholderiaceae bacterium]
MRPHAPPPQGRRPSGFTLVEVLVALSIMAVIAIMSWRAIDGMARAQQTTDEYTDGVLSLQAALGQWRADLDAMMVWPATTPPSPAAPVSLLWDGRMLRITRSVSGNAAAGVEVAAWTRRGGDGAWMRWQSAPVQTMAAWRAAWSAAANWSGAGASGANAQAVTVAHALDWQLQYFRNNAWTNPLSSAAESSTQTDVLPDAVRLLITLAPGQAISGLLTIDWIRPTFGGTP